MKNALIFLIPLFFIVHSAQSQFLIPGEGFMDVKLGYDWDEIEWELGFRGFKVDKADIDSASLAVAQKAGIDFDFMVNYQCIMWAPVTKLYLKDNKVIMMQFSSYPEYNKMLCADIGTEEGLNFWDNSETVKKIYNNAERFDYGDKAYFLIKEKGLVIELTNDEVRSMFIFKPEME